ncbi:MAG: hypothetical protein HC812_01055 [Leptolyngbya sp. RL_3_1]|nr:hypothetical protein [Leptolyngbya sp. RL_3_1]
MADETWQYEGVSIAMAEGQVWSIFATSAEFCTISGVCPGQSITTVFEILGPTTIDDQTYDMPMAFYRSPEVRDCALRITIAADTISELAIACNA